MADIAWTAIVDGSGYTIGLAERDVAGYSPLRRRIEFSSYDEAHADAVIRNTRMGVTTDEALSIVASSMRAQNLARSS